jgi:hypothetical protein
VGRKFNTENSNKEQSMPIHRVHAETQNRKRQRSCEEIQEEHTREIEIHIETSNGRIWYSAPLHVYNELPTPL